MRGHSTHSNIRMQKNPHHRKLHSSTCRLCTPTHRINLFDHVRRDRCSCSSYPFSPKSSICFGDFRFGEKPQNRTAYDRYFIFVAAHTPGKFWNARHSHPRFRRGLLTKPTSIHNTTTTNEKLIQERGSKTPHPKKK